MKNKILICDESEIVAYGLKKIAESIKLNVVAHVRHLEHLIDKIRTTDAQLLIINPSMYGQYKRELIQNIDKEFPNLGIIAFVSSFADKKVFSQYEYVITMNDSTEEIEATLQRAAHDNKNKSSDNNTLSKRETDILVAVAKGLTNKEISEELNISIHTVISHRKNISKKTGIRSVSGFTVYALLNNLIDEGDIHK